MTEHDPWARFRKEIEEVLQKAAKEIIDAAIDRFLLSDDNLPPKGRAVAIKAKNLEPGLTIEWPGIRGKQIAHNVVVDPDRVIVIGSGPEGFAVFDPDQRVKVYRG